MVRCTVGAAMIAAKLEMVAPEMVTPTPDGTSAQSGHQLQLWVWWSVSVWKQRSEWNEAVTLLRAPAHCLSCRFLQVRITHVEYQPMVGRIAGDKGNRDSSGMVAE